MKKNKDNNKKKHIKKISVKLLIISSILVFLLSIGSTYAVLTWNSGNTTISGQTMCFGIDYLKGQDINFGTSYSSGVYTGMVASTSFDKSKSASTYVGFKRKKGCLLYGKGTIKVNITSSSAPISTGALKYRVHNSNDALVADGAITHIGETTIYDNFDIINNETYTIYFWLDGGTTSALNNDYLEATFTGTIAGSARSAPAYGSITDSNPGYDTLYDLATLDSTAGVDFSQTSEANNTNGLYILNTTQDDMYPILYYRGAVDNNLMFANKCWKIIRTTESGGLRLIYNGAPSSGTCNNTGTASQIGTSKFNSSYNLPAYVGYMYGTAYTRSSGTGTGWYYAPDVSYSGGSYTLTAKGSYNVETKSTISGTNLNYQHYTCGSSTATTCTQVRYVYYVSSSTAYYITLSNGKKVEDALSEMLDYNTTSSTIKGNDTTTGTIDYWYKNNIDNNSSYKNMVDYNEIFCNDRSIVSLNGWDPDGGDINSVLNYGSSNRINNHTPIISCPRDIDKFSASSSDVGNKALTYPVGLITVDEVMIAGGGESSNTSYYLSSGGFWWTMSPRVFSYDGSATVFIVYGSNAYLSDDHVNINYDTVRPVLALKAGYTITGGDGSTGSPYTVG